MPAAPRALLACRVPRYHARIVPTLGIRHRLITTETNQQSSTTQGHALHKAQQSRGPPPSPDAHSLSDTVPPLSSEDIVQTAQNKAAETSSKVRGKANEAFQQAQETASNVRDKASDKASEARGKANETFQQAQETASNVSDKAADKASEARGKANETFQQARETASNISNKVADKASEARDKVSEAASKIAGVGSVETGLHEAQEKIGQTIKTVRDKVSNAVGYVFGDKALDPQAKSAKRGLDTKQRARETNQSVDFETKVAMHPISGVNDEIAKPRNGSQQEQKPNQEYANVTSEYQMPDKATEELKRVAKDTVGRS